MQDVRNQRLSAFLGSPGRFAVYGTGDTAEAVLASLSDLGLKPCALVDRDRGGTLHGLDVVPPDEAVELALDAVLTADPEARDATARLRADGFEGCVLDLSALHEPRWAAHYDERLLGEAADAIEFARSLLVDDGSREIFDGLLRYRRSLDPGALPSPTPAELHGALPAPEGESVLEVGSAGADSVEATLALAEAVGPLGRVHALLPPDERREALCAALETSALGGRVSVHERACGKAWAAGGEGPEAGPVSLDEFVWEHTAGRVDRIRIDAAEVREVLSGAAATLAERRPRLALCVGHGPHDLWELPILLKERARGYRLHLGHHAQDLRGSWCYARPAGA